MKNRKWLRPLKILFILFLSFCFVSNSPIFAMTNSQYATEGLTYSGNTNSLLNVIGELVMPIILPFFVLIEKLVTLIMEVFTGYNFFPWSDLIIFNTIPILDVNFINPSEGSFFLNQYGQPTVLGDTIKGVYFTVLSICLAFLGIAVAVNAIKLILSSLSSSKAKYKEAINSTILTIVLIFGMHYLISFVFYINEQLVVTASTVMQKIVSENTISKALDNIEEAEDENNERIFENFYDDCDHTSWWSPITIAKKALKEMVNLAKEFLDWLGGLFSDDDEEVTIRDRNQKGNKPFPDKEDYKNYFHNLDHGIDVAAYLLKDYNFRDIYVFSVKGNDSNKFSQSGISGLLTSFSNTVVWVTGLVDTGLAGLENLYNATYYVCVDMKNSNIINSAAKYKDFTTYLTGVINDPNKSEKEKNNAKISLLYVNAYYRYVYDGEDKNNVEIASVISDLGTFFKSNIYMVDLDKGDWAPEQFNVVCCLLYCIFIIQSMMFLWSYLKRFFYVVILALLGPVVVVYDYMIKSY